MQARELPVFTVDEALRVVRALGKHRYVAGRAHFVHALAAATDDRDESELGRWARSVLGDESIDKTSRDERLVRRATEEEVCAVLAAFWGDASSASREVLRARLERFEIDPGGREAFGEQGEDDVFPVLVDAGWELLALAELDTERHRGAIEAFGEPILFEAARFEEQEHLPKTVHLQELDVLGVAELLHGASGGDLAQPLTLWLCGNETYQDYVVRGVLRAAKLAP